MQFNSKTMPAAWQPIEQLPDRLYTADQVRAIDAAAIAAGTPGIVLMSRAARAVLEALLDWSASNTASQANSICVLCGTGNNAGDGYLVARFALERGMTVTLFEVADPTRLSGDALLARNSALDAGVKPLDFKQLEKSDLKVDMIVDALLGTGISGLVRPNYAAAIAKINASAAPVVAVDIPSGIVCNTGAVAGDQAVIADLTVSFIALKRGLFTGAAVDYVGNIVFASLDVVDVVSETGQPASRLLKLSGQAKKIPRRGRNAYKNQSGHLLVIGGDYGMAGAPLLTATAALRCGTGLVTVATRPEHIGAIVSRQPDLMAIGIEKTSALAKLIDRASAIVIGPGLGMGPWSQQLLQQIKQLSIPVLLDADALNLISANRHFLPQGPAVLTPHSGEAARLLAAAANQAVDSKGQVSNNTQGIGGEINANRFASIETLVNQYDKTWVLKGAGSLIMSGDDQSPGGQCVDSAVCPYGNSAMATAGMGDILSGVIGAWLAQGLNTHDAAELGVVLHAAAADLAVQQVGQYGLAASDMPAALRDVINAVLRGDNERCQ